MTRRRKAIPTWAKVLLCAFAIAGGASVAHLTDFGRPTARAHSLFSESDAPSLVRTAHAQTQTEATHSEPPEAAPQVPAPQVEADLIPVGPRDEKPNYHELHPAPEMPDPLGEQFAQGRVITGHTPHRLILFTFDDGPDHRNTPRLLDMLDREGIKAVFFLTSNRFSGHGQRHIAHREIVQDIVRRGHIVGNHTLGHQNLPSLGPVEIQREVVGGQRVFEAVLGQRPWLLRPPGGGRTSRTDRYVSQQGYTTMMWNLGTGDTQVRSAEEVLQTFQRVISRREREGDRGGIVLLHDIHAWSVRAFPMIVDWLRSENCRLLDEGEELYDFVDDPRYFYAELEGADPSVDAPVAVLDPDTHYRRQLRVYEDTLRRCRAVAQADER